MRFRPLIQTVAQAVTLFLAALCPSEAAGTARQSLTASIVGTVADAVVGIPGIMVTLLNERTSAARTDVTDAHGVFRFPDVLPGTYMLSVAGPGFRSYEQRGITIGATDRVALRPIVLEIGPVIEQLTVRSDAAALLQTKDGARSVTVPRTVIEDITSKARLFTDYISLLPGVVNTGQRDLAGSGVLNELTVNGRGSFNFTLDGITNKDTGTNQGNHASPALDAIAEIRVQMSSFQAEYGRSAGAAISVVTRSGSRDFHGSLAYYKRHEALNENEFDRKYACSLGTNFPKGTAAQRALCDKPVYRYDNTAWTIGGPLLLPGTRFNAERDRLFFFFSQDLLPRHDPGTLTLRRLPTELERAGDFSQTRNPSGNLVLIRDPSKRLPCSPGQLAGCFVDNRIPSDRIDPYGQALLNLLPLPNQPLDAQGANHTYQSDQKLLRTDQIARVDWNASPAALFYSRVQWGYERLANNRPENGWPVIPQRSTVRTFGVVNTFLYSVSRSTVAEATMGVNWAHQQQNEIVGDDTLAKIDRRTVLPGWDQLFPQANVAFDVPIVPGTSFGGGISGVPGYGGGVGDRFPFSGRNRIWNLSTNVTHLRGNHTYKVGLFVDFTERPATSDSAPYGNIVFGSGDPSNLCDTLVGMANALTGCVQQYTESDRRTFGNARFTNVEWYLQDNWSVRRNFTLDYGLRLYHVTPTKAAGQQVAQFVPTRWNAAAAPVLYQPACLDAPPCLGRPTRVALDPTTGQTLPAVNIGRLVPGSGDPYNGQVVYDETVFEEYPRVKFGPRVGFAWDVAGNGRTALRGGAGAYYDRLPDLEFIALAQQPPLLNTYTINHVTIPDLRSLSAGSSQLLLSPRSVSHWPSFDPPVTYNWNLSLQRELDFGGPFRNFVADVAYVASASRHQLNPNGAGAPAYLIQLNGRPLGYRSQPASVDPTTGLSLSDDLLRPMQGIGSVAVFGQNGYADYHSVQMSISGRSVSGLALGAAYTHEIVNKGLRGIAWELDPNCQTVAALDECGLNQANRDRFYNSAGRRPHTAVVHWSYRLPAVSRFWNNRIARAALDDWRVSGVTKFQSGAYQAIPWTYAPASVPAGTVIPFDSGVGSALGGNNRRVHFTCDPNLPRRERTFERQFRTECVAVPADEFQIGDSKGDEYLGLGYSNWDITFAKAVRLRGARALELRVELYNAFNTNQWTGVNLQAQFDYTTKALTNLTAINQTTGETEASFGSLTRSTRSARRMQIAARFTF